MAYLREGVLALGDFSDLSEVKEDGFHSKLSPQDIEKNRFYLIYAKTCPFANRVTMTLGVKGLSKIINSFSVEDILGSYGWSFGIIDKENKDPLFNFSFLKDYYLKANPKYTGPITVPILWDNKQNTIISNSSLKLMEILNDSFNDFARNDFARNDFAHNDIDLMPVAQKKEQDKLRDFIAQNINIQVYKVGASKTQKQYEIELNQLFSALNEMDQRLKDKKFLMGDNFTAVDIQLFSTLIRFDIVYYSIFKCSLKHIWEYESLLLWLKRVYNFTGIKENIFFESYSTYSLNVNFNNNKIRSKLPDKLIIEY